jgi:hypothetical protein
MVYSYPNFPRYAPQFAQKESPNVIEKIERLLAAFEERQVKIHEALEAGKSGLDEEQAAAILKETKRQIIAAKILRENGCAIVLAELMMKRPDLGFRNGF